MSRAQASDAPARKLQQVCRGAAGVIETGGKPGWRLYCQGDPGHDGAQHIVCIRTNKSGAYCWGPRRFSSSWLANRLQAADGGIDVGPVADIVPGRYREYFVGGGRG